MHSSLLASYIIYAQHYFLNIQKHIQTYIPVGKPSQKSKPCIQQIPICVPRANGPPPRDVTLYVVPYTLDSATPRTEDDQDIDQSGQIETQDPGFDMECRCTSYHLIVS